MQKAPLKDIWIPELKLYRIQRSNQDAANATINRETAVWSGIFRVAIENQIIDANQCRQIKKLSEKSSERQAYLGLEDVQRVMAVCPLWYQDFIWLSYLTGMRKGEIARLRWSHVHIKRRLITFHATETKEGKSKRVPIHRDLIPLFERMGRVRNLQNNILFPVSYDLTFRAVAG